MTAREVHDAALALVDSVEDIGDDESDYAEKSPALIDLLQRELARLEGIDITQKIESLDDELEISDDTASRIMPYGLAANFALADKNGDMYNDYSYMYRALCRTIAHDEETIEDGYNIISGMQI